MASTLSHFTLGILFGPVVEEFMEKLAVFIQLGIEIVDAVTTRIGI